MEHRREHVLYYLPGVPRRNAQTGVTTVVERGPHHVCILGCVHRHVTDDEATEYVLGVHGVEPTRIERQAIDL